MLSKRDVDLVHHHRHIDHRLDRAGREQPGQDQCAGHDAAADPDAHPEQGHLHRSRGTVTGSRLHELWRGRRAFCRHAAVMAAGHRGLYARS